MLPSATVHFGDTKQRLKLPNGASIKVTHHCGFIVKEHNRHGVLWQSRHHIANKLSALLKVPVQRVCASDCNNPLLPRRNQLSTSQMQQLVTPHTDIQCRLQRLFKTHQQIHLHPLTAPAFKHSRSAVSVQPVRPPPRNQMRTGRATVGSSAHQHASSNPLQRQQPFEP